jgi:hypothetical protein
VTVAFHGASPGMSFWQARCAAWNAGESLPHAASSRALPVSATAQAPAHRHRETPAPPVTVTSSSSLPAPLIARGLIARVG